MSDSRLRLHKLEELRRDLHHREARRRVYALDTLLAQLWVREGRERLETASALFDSPLPVGKAEAPPGASRLCARLSQNSAPFTLPAPPPEPVELAAWVGSALAAVLTEALDTLKAVTHTPSAAHTPLARREIEVCQDTLKLAERFHFAEVGEPCVRALRLFTLDTPRDPGLTAREITLLREAACRALGAISPDRLFLFWYTLGSPDPRARRDLLPALDYIHDVRAIPYLTRLLERRGQWSDGEMVGWFIVRAFERIGDKKAIPVLWRVVSALSSATSVELTREAKRVIEAIEGQKSVRDREHLLRPAGPPTTELLLPTNAPPDREEGLLVRPADPQREELLRPVEISSEELLRPAQPASRDAERDRDELLRAQNKTTE